MDRPYFVALAWLVCDTATMANPPRKRIYDLVGESHFQGALRDCEPGDPIELVREPDNQHHANAVFAQSSYGKIGYISRSEADELAPALDDGQKCSAQIHELRGGTRDFPSIGCRVAIAWEGEKLRNPIPWADYQREGMNEKQNNSGCAAALWAVLVIPIAAILII